MLYSVYLFFASATCKEKKENIKDENNSGCGFKKCHVTRGAVAWGLINFYQYVV